MLDFGVGYRPKREKQRSGARCIIVQNFTPIGGTVAEISVAEQKQVYRRQYESRRSSNLNLSLNYIKNTKKYGEKRFSISCNVAQS